MSQSERWPSLGAVPACAQRGQPFGLLGDGQEGEFYTYKYQVTVLVLLVLYQASIFVCLEIALPGKLSTVVFNI